MNHREFLQSLSPEQRKQLTEKSDAKGLIRLAQYWGLILRIAMLIVGKVAMWPLLLLPLGVLLVFQWFRYFHLEHHRQTHVLGKDPELASPKPQTIREYWFYVSGYLLAEHTGCPHTYKRQRMATLAVPLFQISQMLSQISIITAVGNAT